MYSFTFRQVEVFLEICRAGNFSGAAEQLEVSQPAISNVVRALELQLGVELFERADHVADGGLRDLQLLGGAAEISGTTDLEEHFDLTERK